MKPILYSSDETSFKSLGLGVLRDEINTLVTEERNGEFFLEMEYPITGIHFSKIKTGRWIKADASPDQPAQRFKIMRISKPAKGTIKLYAEHASYLALDYQLRPESGYSGAGLDLLRAWERSLVERDTNPFILHSDVLTKATGTWEVEDFDNARQVLGGAEGSILDLIGGEYKFDNYRISLFKSRGRDRGIPIMYGKNIVDLEQEEEIVSMYNSVFPYATYTPETVDGIEFEQVTLTLPEYYVDSFPQGAVERRPIKMDFTSYKTADGEEIKTVDDLRDVTNKFINDNDIGSPKISIKLDIIDLAQTLDYKDVAQIEELRLCDWVNVYFYRLGIDRKAKIVRTVYNPSTGRFKELHVGDIRATLSDRINATVDTKFEEVMIGVNEVRASANGKNRNFWGETKPTQGMIEGDTWFKQIGEGEEEIWRYEDGVWKFILSTVDVTKNAREIEKALEELSDVKETADKANKEIDDAITNAGFTTLDQVIDNLGTVSSRADDLSRKAQSNALKGIEDALNAQNKADTAQSNALQSIEDASRALSGVEGVDTKFTNEIIEIDNELARKASKVEVDALTGVVSEQATKISQSDEAIKLKADSSVVDTLKDRVSTAESSLSVLPGMIESKVTQAEVDVAIDNISIGGTNIIDGTSNEWKYSTVNEWSVSIPDTSLEYLLEELDVEVGDWLTSSIYLKIPEEIDLEGMSFQFRVDAITSDGTNNMNKYSGGYVTKEGRLINTFQIDDPDVISLRIRIRVMDYTKSFSMGLRRYKLEKGNKVSDWRPSVADTSKLISNNATSIQQNAQEIILRAKQSEVDNLANRISTNEASITIQNDKISSKVSQFEIDESIDKLKVGAFNLVPDSQNGVRLANNSDHNPSESEVQEGRRAVWADGGNQLSMYNTVTIDIDTLGEYTDSYKVMTEGEDIEVALASSSNAEYTPITGDGTWHTVNRTQVYTSLGPKRLPGLYTRGLPAGQKVYYKEFMMTKGNKSADWTPSIIDTQNAISYVESELTQKYDSITSTISSLDGRVAENKQTLSGFAQTVSGLDSRVTEQRQTIDGFAQTVSGLSGQVSALEQTAQGLQSIVANKANQSQVTQLADGYNILVSSVNSLKSEDLIDRDAILRRHRISGSGLAINVASWDMTENLISIMDDGIASKYLTASLISNNGETYTVTIGYYDLDENYIMFSEDTVTTNDSHTFEPPANARYIRVAVMHGMIDNLKVEKGKGATGIDQEARSQIAVLEDNINLKVSKGDLMSQINVEAGRTLIQSNKIYMDAESVIFSGTAFMPGAVIKDASIDTAQISNLAVTSAKISHLDVSKISGNTTEFVRSAWNNHLDNTQIDGSGIHMLGSGTWRRTYLTATGFDLYNGQGGSGKAGVIGYFKEHGDSASSSENFISSIKGSNHYIGMAVNPTHNIALGWQEYTALSNRYYPVIVIDGYEGIIRFYRPITSGGSNYRMRVTAYDGDYSMYGVGFTSDNAGIIFANGGTYIWKHSTQAWVRF